LPGLTPADLTRFVEEARTTPRSAWLQHVRDWAAHGQGRR
jgi:hypothetical protein